MMYKESAAAGAAVALFCLSTALAQPQGVVLWSYPANDGIYSTVSIRDVNGDSAPDVIGVIYYSNTPSDPRKAYCLSGPTGESLWVNRTAYGTWGNKGLCAAEDLSGDGLEDVVVGTAGTYIPPGRSCVAVNGVTGETLWVFPFGQNRGWCYCVRPFVWPDGRPVDLDHDSFPEVLAGAGGTTNDKRGTAIVLSGHTGDSIWAFRPDYDGCQCLASFVDLNGDTVPEVLVGAGGNGTDNRAFCVSGRNGSLIWQYETGNSVYDIRRIPDVNRSGTDDVICGGWDYKVHCLEGTNGDSIWARSLGSGNIVTEVAIIRDVNADGIDDVVAGSWASEVYVLSGADGSTIWTGAMANDVWSVDTVADLTGDHVPEVVAGCLGDGTGAVKVFSGASGEVLWYYTFTERVYDVTGGPDLDGDGNADVLVGLQDHENDASHLYAFSGTAVTAMEDEPHPAARAALLEPLPGGTGLMVNVPTGTAWVLKFIDPTGRAAGPLLRGMGTSRAQTVEPGRLAGRIAFARLELADGSSASAKLVRLGR